VLARRIGKLLARIAVDMAPLTRVFYLDPGITPEEVALRIAI
jgi:hypothetical protein